MQLFEQVPSPTQEKLSWNDVLQISDHLSKQATIGFVLLPVAVFLLKKNKFFNFFFFGLISLVGMLWTGEPPKSEALKETMEAYFNALQGFLLHCHGSMVGAGTTLSSSIHASAKQIVDSSFRLLQGSVSLYGKKTLCSSACIRRLLNCV